MKDAIKYFYDIYPNKIYAINNGYYFFYHDIKYYFIKYNRDITEVNFLVDITNNLYNRNIFVDTFIINKYNKYINKIGEDYYVLLKVNYIESDTYNLQDIVYFNNLLISNNNYKLSSNYIELWSKKVDIYEMEVNEINNDYPLITESFDYYIGLCETAISYLQEINISNVKVCISHKRLDKNISSGSINNPLLFTFDYEIRDISEYIKIKFFNGIINYDEIEEVLSKYNKDTLMLLYARLMYPSYYFDSLKKIFENDISDKVLLKYIDKIPEYEDFLVYIYNLISKKYNITKVEWLHKN